MNDASEGGQIRMPGNIRRLLLLKVLKGALQMAALAGYGDMDWRKGATLERRMPRIEFDGRDDISHNWAKVHQKGLWNLCGWEFHSQIIKLLAEECT